MYSRALFATDLSAASEVALDHLAGWKDVEFSAVTVVHVHSVRYSSGRPHPEERLRAEHAERLEAQARRLRAAGIPTSWRLEFGVPYLDLERIAHDEKAGVVVIGSHGQSWRREVGLGSTATAILENVMRAVMVVKVNGAARHGEGQGGEAGEPAFARVLVGTDFSPGGNAAVRFVEDLAGRTRANVRLSHVQERSRIFPHLEDRLDEFNEEDARRLAAAAGALRARGAGDISIDLRTDHPVPGLLAAIDEWRPRLVVLGRYGRGRGGRRQIGSTARDVTGGSPVPVLVVPEE